MPVFLGGGALWLTILVLGMFGCWYWYRERYTIQETQYTLHLANLPKALDGLTILHLSDLHSKQFGQRQAKLLRVINRQPYDLVALTGDFVNKFRPDLQPMADLLNGLRPVPIFFVPGNHEWTTGFKAKDLLLNAGVRVLENQAEPFGLKGQQIWIVGVDDPYLHKDQLDQALAPADGPGPKILLTHSPNVYPEAVKNKLDLVLAGHTHGGQVRLPFIGAAIAPGQGLFPRWDYGIYQQDLSTMIISCGLGESDLPIRFNIKPEVVRITLRSDYSLTAEHK